MAGSVLLAIRLKRPVFRAEGRRRGFHGAQLETFVTILAGFDDTRVELDNKATIAAFAASIPKK